MCSRTWLLAAAVAVAALGCARGKRARAPEPDFEPGVFSDTATPPPPIWGPASSDDSYCVTVGRHDIFVQSYSSCGFAPREVRAWGSVPREEVPGGVCPTHVRSLGDHVIAEPMGVVDAFGSLPFRECVPREYAVGARHVLEVDDGFLVAYETLFEGIVYWTSRDGVERRSIAGTRILGFVRSPSGKVLALARGKARLGRGGVLRIDHAGRGDWRTTLLAVLPVEPSGATLDDHGTLVGFAQGFVFRAGEDGHIENIHYVSRFVGRVASIARDDAGSYYLGLECGVLRIDVADRDDHREEWWSARDGASGRWSPCGS